LPFAAAFLIRALRWRERSIRVERVMTDNGSGYVARLFARVLRLLRIRHIRTRPYTPNTNGKAERFIQTLRRAKAYATAFPSSQAKTDDLPRWIDWYNHRRPHASLARRSPAQALAETNLIG
jgi:transposase InsO family protein